MKNPKNLARLYRTTALLLTALGTVGQLYAMLFGYDVAMCVYQSDNPAGTVMGWILFASVMLLTTAFFVLPKETACRPMRPCGNALAFLVATTGGAAVCSSVMIAFDAAWPYVAGQGSLGDLLQAVKGNSLLLLSLLVALSSIPAGLYLIASAVSRKTEDKRLAVLGFFPVIWMATCLLRLYFDRNAAINDPLKTLLQISLAAIMLYFLGELRSRVGKSGVRFRFVMGTIALLLGATSSVSTLTLGLMGADIVRGEWMMAVTELLLAIYIAARLPDCYREEAVETPEAVVDTEEENADETEETVTETSEEISDMRNEIPTTTEKKMADIVVLAGQSNAVGVGHCAYLPRHFEGEELNRFFRPYENVKLRFYSHNFKNEAFAPTTVNCSEKGRDTFGPEIGIADSLSRRYPDREIFIVKCAFGGTSLHHDWAIGEDRFRATEDGTRERPVGGDFNREAGWCFDELIALLGESITKLEEEGYAPSIRAFLWMQGESDACAAEHAAAYGSRYRKLTDAFRERFAPYLADGIHVDGGISELWEFHREVNAFKQIFASEGENRFFIDTVAAGLTTNHEPDDRPDMAHYDSDSVIKLGRLFAEKITLS